jgi:CheY-like chemotaxis protein
VANAAPPKLSLLVVDDDDVAAEAVVRGLRKHGLDWDIVIAQDGRDALQVMRGELPDRRISKPYLVIVDLNMPRMNGIEFLRELRADPALRGTVVFVLTTSPSESDRKLAYQESIAGYLVKSNLGPQLSGLAKFLAEYRNTVMLP